MCTKYFHAMKPISYRKNVITQLRDSSGNLSSDHESKAALIWIAFKNRMRIHYEPIMHFDLADLIVSQDLECLVQPFTKEEIDSVINMQIPTDEARGPDGFSGIFIRSTGPY